MQIPVTRDKDNQTALIMLDLNDVIYVHTQDRNVVYHTIDDQFFHLMPSLTVLAKHTEDLGFKRLDRINLVNMEKIQYFDDEYAKIYFYPKEQIDKNSKYATISFLNKGKLKKYLKQRNEK